MKVEEMKIERFTQIIDSYGGDPLRWPETERLAAQGLAARDPRAAALLDEVEALDAMFDTAPTLEADEALKARILARRPRPSLWREMFPNVPAWRPALGFALALAVGVGVQSAAAERLGLDTTDEVAASSDASDEDTALTPLSGGEGLSEEDVL